MAKKNVYIGRIREALKARNLADNGLAGWGTYRKNAKNFILGIAVICIGVILVGLMFVVKEDLYSNILAFIATIVIVAGVVFVNKGAVRYSISMSGEKLILVPFKNQLDYDQGKSIPKENIKFMEVKGVLASKLIIELTNGTSLKLNIGDGKRDVSEIVNLLMNSSVKEIENNVNSKEELEPSPEEMSEDK